MYSSTSIVLPQRHTLVTLHDPNRSPLPPVGSPFRLFREYMWRRRFPLQGSPSRFLLNGKGEENQVLSGDGLCAGSLCTLLPYVHHALDLTSCTPFRKSLEKVPQLIPRLLCIYLVHHGDPRNRARQ